MKYQDCQSCWHALFTAIINEQHVLFNQDVGQDFVQELRKHWISKRLIGDDGRFGVAALYNAMKQQQRSLLANRCVFPAQLRKVEDLLLKPVMSSACLADLKQRAHTVLTEFNGKAVSEQQAHLIFGSLLDCAKSTSSALMHTWMTVQNVRLVASAKLSAK